jgi:phage tail tape-measure protein
MPEDPTALFGREMQIGLTVALAEVIKRAWCGDDEAMRDRFGPLIAVGAGMLIALLSGAYLGERLETVLILGAVNGLGATFGYLAIKRGSQAAVEQLRRKAPSRPAVHRPRTHTSTHETGETHG